MAHWPICSVWAFANRRKLVALSLSSWYKFNTKYQFRIKTKKGKFKKKYSPLKAPRPNHTWHADITIVQTLDMVKHYVYLIVDNYSKYIINWKIHNCVSGAVRTQTIQEAIEQEFGTVHSPNKSIDLIVDGGSENNNKNVHKYIEQAPVTIHKKIAMKDIDQSNSIVEASNKILKHRYLFLNPSENGDELYKNITNAVEDFCHFRPHYALNTRTPSEAHYQKHISIDKSFSKNAVKERIKNNKSNACQLNCD